MAFTPTNYIYENVLTKLESILKVEYDGGLPIYIGEEYKKNRNSHIRLFINSIQNIDSKEKSIINQIELSVNLYLNIKSSDITAKEKLFDMTNRLEQVLFENKLDPTDLYFDGRVERVELDNLRVSRINYSVKIPLNYNIYGFYLLSNGDNFLTSSGDNFLVLN